ncbi:MAG: alpha/beta hydrolase [Acidimicrobiales bacterium]
MLRPSRRFRQLSVITLVIAGGALLARSVRRRVTEMQPHIDRVAPELRSPVLHLRLDVDQRRLATVRRLTGLARLATTGSEVGEHVVENQSGRTGPRVLTYQSAGRERPSGALLWIHGGGMVLGLPEQDHGWCTEVADELGVLVASVDYRLAPEHPFPAGLDDCMAALQWLHDHATDLGVDPTRIAVGGASAGAGLAASVCQRARDENGPEICFQLLNYPMLDDRTVLTDDHEGRGAFVWTPASNRFGWTAYLGSAPTEDDDRAHAAPGRTEDLSGLPPAWLGVGDLDLFYPEDVDYATRLEDAGVACTLHTVEGMYHGADGFVAGAPSMRDYRASMISALRGAIA